MTSKNGKDTPSKKELSITSFKAEPLTLAEGACIEKYIKSLHRS